MENLDEKLITLSELSRLANIPLSKLARAVQAGSLSPDYRLNNRILFLRERLNLIRAQFSRSTQLVEECSLVLRGFDPGRPVIDVESSMILDSSPKPTL
jgi:hypothetical protein